MLQHELLVQGHTVIGYIYAQWLQESTDAVQKDGRDEFRSTFWSNRVQAQFLQFFTCLFCYIGPSVIVEQRCGGPVNDSFVIAD